MMRAWPPSLPRIFAYLGAQLVPHAILACGGSPGDKLFNAAFIIYYET